MAQTPKNTLKSWFSTGMKPVQDHFHSWLDSFWHKAEQIPLERISGSDTLVNADTVRDTVSQAMRELNVDETVRLAVEHALDEQLASINVTDAVDTAVDYKLDTAITGLNLGTTAGNKLDTAIGAINFDSKATTAVATEASAAVLAATGDLDLPGLRTKITTVETGLSQKADAATLATVSSTLTSATSRIIATESTLRATNAALAKTAAASKGKYFELDSTNIILPEYITNDHIDLSKLPSNNVKFIQNCAALIPNGGNTKNYQDGETFNIINASKGYILLRPTFTDGKNNFIAIIEEETSENGETETTVTTANEYYLLPHSKCSLEIQTVQDSSSNKCLNYGKVMIKNIRTVTGC